MNIYVNQLGYLTKSIKRAVLALDVQALSIDKRITVRIVDSTGNCVLEKEAVYIGIDACSKDMVWRVDFTELQTEGCYRIESSCQSYSPGFRIGDNLYGELLVSLAKTYYYQRCGMALEEKYAGIFKRESCHHGNALLLEDYRKMQEGMPSEAFQWYEVTGGWHDAGDYGRYTTAAATALAHLLYAWQWFPKSFDRSLNIPESSKNMADILCECQYELQWLLKMQREDGAVFHKLTSMRHANFVMPCEDKRQMVLFPVSSYATGAFAAVMALAARIYKPFDEELSETMLQAAKKAWLWLEEHTELTEFQNPQECNTGEYDDSSDADERLWAAAELYRSTGESKYLDYAHGMKKKCEKDMGLGWRDVAGFAGFALLEDEIKDAMNMEGEQDDGIELEMKRDYYRNFIKEAEMVYALSEQSGYMAAMEERDFEWGSNMSLLVRGMLLVVAWRLSGRQEFLNTIVSQMDYLLGVNATGYSYVTGVGEKSIKNIHNRITVADGIEEVIPGYVSGGANRHPVDEKAEWLIEPDTAPMKCFLDVWECYSLNEITIYWNSPAVFLAAFLDCVEVEIRSENN